MFLGMALSVFLDLESNRTPLIPRHWASKLDNAKKPGFIGETEHRRRFSKAKNGVWPGETDPLFSPIAALAELWPGLSCSSQASPAPHYSICGVLISTILQSWRLCARTPMPFARSHLARHRNLPRRIANLSRPPRPLSQSRARHSPSERTQVRRRVRARSRQSCPRPR